MNGTLPQTFQTPNLLVDKLMHLLTDQELRVTLFIIRHTVGWPEAQPISLDDFEHGCRGSEGCGLSRPAIATALADLRQARVVERSKKRTRHGFLWSVAQDEAAVDWAALSERLNAARARSAQKVERAAQAAREKRISTTDVLIEAPRISTTDVLIEAPRISTTDVLIEMSATGPISTTDVLSPHTPLYRRNPEIQKDLAEPDGSAERADGLELPGEPPPLSDPDPAPLTPFRAAQTAVIECWFDGDWKEAAWAGDIAHLLRGSAEKRAYAPYNLDPPMEAEEIRRWAGWLRAEGVELPTAPQKLRRWAVKFRATVTAAPPSSVPTPPRRVELPPIEPGFLFGRRPASQGVR